MSAKSEGIVAIGLKISEHSDKLCRLKTWQITRKRSTRPDKFMHERNVTIPDMRVRSPSGDDRAMHQLEGETQGSVG